jgi:hypothetical protein
MKAPISDLQNVIAEVIARQESAYDVASVCEFLGLEPQKEDNPWHSKRVYVLSRLKNKTLDFLIELADKVVERYQDEELEIAVKKFMGGGVVGEAKNIIFAANGPKPKLVLADAVNNTISIVRNAEFCLVYDKPITSRGLLWSDLVLWWKGVSGYKDAVLEKDLYERLKDSLGENKVERFFFKTYYQEFSVRLGDRLPALVPQVYLHYDPQTLRELGGKRDIPRERMDFLMLFSERDRVVIEIDGKQHYSIEDLASPKKYADMVMEDRRLRLLGYEVYRFGGYEFIERAVAYKTTVDFFYKLFEKHGITVD